MNSRTLLFVIGVMATLSLQVTPIIVPWETLEGLALLILYGPWAPPPKVLSVNPTIKMTTGELLQHFGYPYEKHVVTTSDGYILELHRIPSRNNASDKSQVILMVTGLFTDSAWFLSNGRKSSALLFHDAGHDVWLHNHRGTRYTRKHQTLSPERDAQFWDYSFHEMGVYDLPAAVDHIHNVTRSKVYLVGHSMGGTATTIFLAEKPEYHDKESVLGAFLWAPAISLRRTHQIFTLKYIRTIAEIVLIVAGNTPVLPYNENYMLLASHLCSGKIFSKICAMNIFIGTLSYTLLTADYEKGEGTMAFFSARLSGTNVKTLRHFLQMATNGDFRPYNYGSKTNMKIYGQKIPREYNLEAIDVPVSIFQSEADIVVRVEDTVEASQRMKKLVAMNIIKDKWFDHMDFALSDTAVPLVYAKMLNQMTVIAYDDQPLSSPSLFHFAYAAILLTAMVLGMALFALFVRQRAKNRELYS